MLDLPHTNAYLQDGIISKWLRHCGRSLAECSIGQVDPNSEAAPNPLEVRGETAMDTVTDRLDGRSLSETDRVGQIGLFASSLGVDSSDCQ